MNQGGFSTTRSANYGNKSVCGQTVNELLNLFFPAEE